MALPRNLPLIYILPNAFTLLGMCVGLSAIRFALAGSWEKAVAAIIVAAVMDGMDGRLARLLKATSNFGAQLDSLSDFVNFGVVPAIVMYLWSLEQINRVGWAMSIFYIVCCAIRLARFNSKLDAPDPYPFSNRFFTGMAAPMGASISVILMVLNFEYDVEWGQNPWIAGFYFLFIAFLMASRIPTFSIKRLTIRRDYVMQFTVLAGLLVVMLTIEPWGTLLAIGIGYMVSILFSSISFWRLKRQYEAGK
ncbi:CDP-diacylglycerol O-phosphatidyltransferase [bacterium]|nr:CDP-diacylglycerol O-phosphatidyltransferase [bacterium]